MEFASIKVLFESERVRVLPRLVGGAPFSGPGVDLLGAEGEDLIQVLRRALGAWFRDRGAEGPRSIVFHFEDRSVVATSLGLTPGERPVVTRLDANSSQDLFDMIAPLLPEIRTRTARALERRAAR